MYDIIIILVATTVPPKTISEPEIVTFCQITWTGSSSIYEPEPPYPMLVLAALKRLNFRVQSPWSGASSNDVKILYYLCEHTGEGVNWNIVQKTLREIVQDTLIPTDPRSFRSPDRDIAIRWTCGWHWFGTFCWTLQRTWQRNELTRTPLFSTISFCILPLFVLFWI